MSKFVLSSFLVGLGASFYVTIAVNERIYDRKMLFEHSKFELKYNNEELVEAYYQQKLRERIQEKQMQLRKSQIQELRESVNSKVIPVILDASNKLFAKSPQELIDEISKKFK